MIWLWINDTISLSSWCIPLLITRNAPLVCNSNEFHSTMVFCNAYVGQTCMDFHRNMPLDVNSIYMLLLFLLWGFPPFLSAKKVITNIIIHQTHYEKSDWSRAFNQFTIACELDMIMQYLLQILHLSCQVQSLPGY